MAVTGASRRRQPPPTVTEPGVVSPSLITGPSRFLNRHLSWLDFNARVLELAADPSTPLLERAKFLAIFSRNLDEFFQVRVGGLKEQFHAGLPSLSPDGMTTEEQLLEIRNRVVSLVEMQMGVFADVVERLEQEHVHFSDYRGLDPDDRGYVERVFEEQIFPVLTPLAVDPAHPFPYISDLSLNLAVVVTRPGSDASRVARIKMPPLLPRFIVMPDGERFVPLEQVIAANLERLFPGMSVVAHHPFRVTRNADLALEEAAGEDLLSAVETFLRRRRRSPRVVRLEVDSTMPESVLKLLMRELEITPDDVYTVTGPLDLGGLWALYRINRPDLRERPWTPVTQPRLSTDGDEQIDLFRVIAAGDVLVHHPYDSFETSTEAFIEQAARDPQVLAIKQTLYRTGGAESPIVDALIHAAEEGKQVVVLVELTARFDEEANITWARQLEEAGVHVVYGLVGLKTHAKLCLVMRREADRIRRYCHIGTGNYNQETARTYEDLGLLTVDREICADLTELFNYLTGYSLQRRYRGLLVAPLTLRDSLLELIRQETHEGGRIFIKVNHLVDAQIIDALYAASAAGAEVDLVVRSSCSLRAGVRGLSDNIRVRSIVGRYLEHSRIYCFGHDGDADWYFGSADLMVRNLDGRVEALTPVRRPELRARLAEVVDALLADDVLAWELEPDGSWMKVPTELGISVHDRLEELARARAGHGP
ncbi:MAG: polyphosphate kinase 1 [Chloroflexi bacterium]|nr:MAG: polyphosphate kinase 1 [Chloroflexota bacterium]